MAHRRHSKYGNVKIEIDGHKFDSRAESDRYLELIMLERAGEISGLQVHPTYQLLAPYIRRDGVKVRGITYKADFAYVEHGVRIVEDVKGVQTQVFKLKRKLFEKRYPAIDFRIIQV